MTFYNLPGVDAKVEFDAKAKVLVISGLSAFDSVALHPDSGDDSQKVSVYLR